MNRSIFDKTKIGNLVLKNRLIRSALMQRFVGTDGIVTAEEADDLEAVSKGGAAMIIPHAFPAIAALQQSIEAAQCLAR